MRHRSDSSAESAVLAERSPVNLLGGHRSNRLNRFVLPTLSDRGFRTRRFGLLEMSITYVSRATTADIVRTLPELGDRHRSAFPISTRVRSANRICSQEAETLDEPP
jgi:hypothetical protein